MLHDTRVISTGLTMTWHSSGQLRFSSVGSKALTSPTTARCMAKCCASPYGWLLVADQIGWYGAGLAGMMSQGPRLQPGGQLSRRQWPPQPIYLPALHWAVWAPPEPSSWQGGWLMWLTGDAVMYHLSSRICCCLSRMSSVFLSALSEYYLYRYLHGTVRQAIAYFGISSSHWVQRR